MKNNKIWFKAKKYGWGWQPASLEGYVVTVVYILYLIGALRITDAIYYSSGTVLINYTPHFIIATVILLIICYFKGEKPGWHWGNKK